MEYVIYTDESLADGAYFSNFYGGVLVRSQDLATVRGELEAVKVEQSLFSEAKWSKVTAQYLDRYAALVDSFFDHVVADRVKVRVMFTQNVHRPTGLETHHRENRYFLLYYQFLKHAFGLRHSNPEGSPVKLRLNLDQMPGTREAKALFRGHVTSLEKSPPFRHAGLHLPADQIAEVDSRDHVILQGLDLVLGAMQFRLNDKHKVKPPGSRRRGKKTIAKEKLYKRIRKRIVEMHPGFNIGISTGTRGRVENRWRHSYRHWKFVPRKHRYDTSRTKG